MNLRKYINRLFHVGRIRFGTYSIYQGHLNITYRGVPAWKCPFDYVIYQMIITELKPDLVIELGTNMGGGALYLADLMEMMGHGRIHTIDIEDKAYNDLMRDHPRIERFVDGWENYEFVESDKRDTVLIIDDASHTYQDTLAALRKFSSLVTVGSYYIVEDGIIQHLGMGRQYNGGPLRAIKEFLNSTDEYIIDRQWCDLFGKNATFNVDGYLKRIK